MGESMKCQIKRFQSIILQSIIFLVISGCILMVSGCAVLLKDKKEKIIEVSELIHNLEKVSQFIEENGLEESHGFYTSDNPEFELELDTDGYMTMLYLESEGLYCYNIQVGDKFSKKNIQSKLGDEYEYSKKYSSDTGICYMSEDREWYFYIGSKDQKKIDEIILAKVSDENLAMMEIRERCPNIGKKTSQSTKPKKRTKETMEETIAESITPVESTLLETTQMPQTVVVPIVVPQGQGEYIFPDSSTRSLTDVEINSLSGEMARYALNEIYARHGRKFKSADLQQYFNSKSWYRGTIEADSFNENILSNIERENVNRLSKKKEQGSVAGNQGNVSNLSKFEAGWIYGTYEYQGDYYGEASIGWYSDTGEDYIELNGSTAKSSGDFTGIMIDMGNNKYYAVDEQGNEVYITYNGVDGITIDSNGDFGGISFPGFYGFYRKIEDLSKFVS